MLIVSFEMPVTTVGFIGFVTRLSLVSMAWGILLVIYLRLFDYYWDIWMTIGFNGI